MSPHADCLALFTGELARRHGTDLAVPNLAYLDDDAGAFHVRYQGPLLAFPTLTPFLDLESGLARGELVEASVALRFAAPASSAGRATTFGRLEGRVMLGDVVHEIRTIAQASLGPLPVSAPYPHARLSLPSTPLGSVELRSTGAAPADPSTPERPATPGSRRFAFAVVGSSSGEPGDATVTGACDLRLATAGGDIRIDLARDDGARARLQGAIERVIPVRRPGRAGAIVETVYALCRFPVVAPGWLELTVERHRSGPRA